MNTAEILQELRELRRENQELFTDTKASLSRLEAPVTYLKQRMWKLEQRAGEADSRTSATEDIGQKRREATLSSRCDGIQRGIHSINLRIYQAPRRKQEERHGWVCETTHQNHTTTPTGQ